MCQGDSAMSGLIMMEAAPLRYNATMQFVIVEEQNMDQIDVVMTTKMSIFFTARMY